jgi:hypothetical protein
MLRTTRTRPLLLGALATALLTSCGDSTGVDPDAPLRATIDGVPWSALELGTGANGGASGTFTVVGADDRGRVLTLSVFNIGVPGTYPLGVGASVFGGTASLAEGSSAWWTPLSGSAGEIVITTVSATRLAGTFSFVAVPLLGAAAGNRSVTHGAFDVEVNSSGSVTVPENAGSRFGGTLGGQPWNAATVAMVSGPASGSLSMGLSNDTHQVNLVLDDFTGAATYEMSTDVARFFGVTHLPTGNTWGGTGTTNAGSVVVTDMTGSRMVGTYDVTLEPGTANPGPGTLHLTGTFDIGIP